MYPHSRFITESCDFSRFFPFSFMVDNTLCLSSLPGTKLKLIVFIDKIMRDWKMVEEL